MPHTHQVFDLYTDITGEKKSLFDADLHFLFRELETACEDANNSKIQLN